MNSSPTSPVPTNDPATLFANRLRNRVRHLRRWPTRQGIHCYRLYDRDVQEVPLVVDRYADHLVVAEVVREHGRTEIEHTAWLERMLAVASEVTGVPRPSIHLRRRQRMAGKAQYTRRADLDAERLIVEEGGLRFLVDLDSYLDTGLFLDHRITRGLVREEALGKRFLNLFAYTGSFTVYAAAGGACATTTVDLSRRYLDWARRNLELNELAGPTHHFVVADSMTFLREHLAGAHHDLMVIDPPTFSNSKRLREPWDVQRDHGSLLQAARRVLAPGGTIYFSTNSRRFTLDPAAVEGFTVRDITARTIPPDFRNPRIHRCWRLTHA